MSEKIVISSKCIKHALPSDLHLKKLLSVIIIKKKKIFLFSCKGRARVLRCACADSGDNTELLKMGKAKAVVILY